MGQRGNLTPLAGSSSVASNAFTNALQNRAPRGAGHTNTTFGNLFKPK
jgi:hypothetical protein